MGNRRPFRLDDYLMEQPPTWEEAERRAYETNTNGGYDDVDPLMRRDSRTAPYPKRFLDDPASSGRETPVHGRSRGTIRDIPRDPDLEYEGRPQAVPQPWDASDEPDAFSPAEMIRPDSMYGDEEQAADEESLEGWIDAATLDERMLPRRQDRTMLEVDPSANEYLAADALEMTAGMRGEKIDPEIYETEQRFGAGDKRMRPTRR